MANKDTSKQWFETGDFPTQAQFAQVFEWMRWKDEAISMGDVTGLNTALSTKAPLILVRPEEVTMTENGSFLMNEKYKLVGVAVANNTGNPMTLVFSKTNDGAGDIGSIDVEANGYADVEFGITFWQEGLVYVTGVTGEIILLIDRK